MKLAAKYRRHYLVMLVGVLLLGFVTQYGFFRYSIHRSTDDVLREYRCDLEEYARRHHDLPVFNAIELQHSSIRRTDCLGGLPEEPIYDSVIFSDHKREPVVHRVLNFVVATPQQNYRVTLTHPMLEEDEVVVATVLSSLSLFVFFFIASCIGIRLSRRTMAPFYHVLQTIRNFHIGTDRKMTLLPTDIDEFDELQRGLDGMMSRIEHDYDALKELMENASHELQTPLSVARMKVEQLAQLVSGNREEMLQLAEINRALIRMTRYNRSLLMIARISSDQYFTREKIDLDVLVEHFLHDHEEIIEGRAIRVEWCCRRRFAVALHPVLAEMLVNNILSNALKFNREGGVLLLSSDEDGLWVENTYANTLPEGDLFKRYTHTADRDDSFGLGLPMVREICDRNALGVRVEVTGERFRIVMTRKAGE